MGLKVYNGTSWVDLKGLTAGISNSNKDIDAVHARVGGSWKKVWQRAYTIRFSKSETESLVWPNVVLSADRIIGSVGIYDAVKLTDYISAADRLANKVEVTIDSDVVLLGQELAPPVFKDPPNGIDSDYGCDTDDCWDWALSLKWTGDGATFDWGQTNPMTWFSDSDRYGIPGTELNNGEYNIGMDTKYYNYYFNDTVPIPSSKLAKIGDSSYTKERGIEFGESIPSSIYQEGNKVVIGVTLPAASQSYKTLKHYGYLRVPSNKTGTYKFWLDSDDASYAWIGTSGQSLSDLEDSITTGNALVNNGGLHGVVSKTGITGTLIEGEVYPILFYFGNKTGIGKFNVYWESYNASGTVMQSKTERLEDIIIEGPATIRAWRHLQDGVCYGGTCSWSSESYQNFNVHTVEAAGAQGYSNGVTISAGTPTDADYLVFADGGTNKRLRTVEDYGLPALRTGTGWGKGLTIKVNGSILGRGGNGGFGGSSFWAWKYQGTKGKLGGSQPQYGGKGGTAIWVEDNITIVNAANVLGGGGGGHGGRAGGKSGSFTNINSYVNLNLAPGGGGGGGAPFGVGGLGGTNKYQAAAFRHPTRTTTEGVDGTSGTLTAGGVGGQGGRYTTTDYGEYGGLGGGNETQGGMAGQIDHPGTSIKHKSTTYNYDTFDMVWSETADPFTRKYHLTNGSSHGYKLSRPVDLTDYALGGPKGEDFKHIGGTFTVTEE